MPYAHSANDLGQRQELLDHLQSVAAMAADFAAPFLAGDIAYRLGLWHDVGKIHTDWQHYLLASEASGRRRGRSPDHKLAGTLLAAQHLGTLALAIQGHHGGLGTLQAVKAALSNHERAAAAKEAIRAAVAQWPRLADGPQGSMPACLAAEADPLDGELFLRLLYSALIDADYLDTERHFHPTAPSLSAPPIAALWTMFERDQRALTGHGQDPVSLARDGIYGDCLRAAEEPPGLFRLTVPTGGGKTRSAMGFALRHALRHDMARIIVAIPFISITEQTASTYRDIFEPDGAPPTVLEHHSAVQGRDEGDDAHKGEWNRLAAQNWDAPLIVTTTVQLFESLFAHTPQRMRKLHRLANAIIILDEAQSLPAPLLTPILDALTRLCRHFHSTVVFSTATQPAFDAIPGFAALQPREIVSDPARYYGALERVRYDWRLDTPCSWETVAGWMGEADQALAIVNTKRDALALYDLVAEQDPTALHLSASLCGKHRLRVIAEIKRRLAAGERCRLVSTQVVEAGVDLDFPLVLRAIGPLDAVIQAAGRCNREGRRAQGTVIVFEPEDGHWPMGRYKTATNLARAILGRGDLDPNSATAVNDYFDQLYNTGESDPRHIQDLRRALDFPEVDRRFHMIDQDTAPVLVKYELDEKEQPRQKEQADPSLKELLRRCEAGEAHPRQLWRDLQPYMVNLPRRQLEQALGQGFATEIAPQLYLWGGAYDERRGLAWENLPPDEMVC